jgi:DUF1365 family protein
MTIDSGIYRGAVVHERIRPRRHRLKYNVFSLLLDIDELGTISQNSKMLAHNKWAFYSIRDNDHGDGRPIRKWVEDELRDHELAECSEKIFMLCYPRILGYVFNPLTVYFCYNKNNTLGAVIYEVHNTFKERHCYVLAVEPSQKIIVKQHCEKEFYVSPFIPENCTYKFRIQEPGQKVGVVIREEDSEGLLFAAAFSGLYTPLSDEALLKTTVQYPLMTIKVMVGIHIEAFKLFFKKIPFIAHQPKKPKAEITSKPITTTS